MFWEGESQSQTPAHGNRRRHADHAVDGGLRADEGGVHAGVLSGAESALCNDCVVVRAQLEDNASRVFTLAQVLIACIVGAYGVARLQPRFLHRVRCEKLFDLIKRNESRKSYWQRICGLGEVLSREDCLSAF
jgi:hypothetical protein